MNLRRFFPADLPMIHEAMERQGMPRFPLEEYPLHGLCVWTDDGVFAAGGWVRQAEGRVGFFDSMVTNPELPSEERHKALELLVPAVIMLAHRLGLTRLLAWTRSPDVVDRSLRHGFTVQPHTFISRPLP